MNDLTHIFSDKSKSDSEGPIEEDRSSQKYQKRSLRHKRLSSRYKKQRDKSNTAASGNEGGGEVVDAMFFDITDWQGIDIPLNDKDKEDNARKDKAKQKEDKKAEKKDSYQRSLSRSEGTLVTRKLSDHVDSTLERLDRRISTLSWPSFDLASAEPDSTSIPEERLE